eukprot:COSAG06_NODE_2409_length_6926_cov_2.496411_8_plen_70_part_00
MLLGKTASEHSVMFNPSAVPPPLGHFHVAPVRAKPRVQVKCQQVRCSISESESPSYRILVHARTVVIAI